MKLYPTLCTYILFGYARFYLGVKDGGEVCVNVPTAFGCVSGSHFWKEHSFGEGAPGTSGPCAHRPGEGAVTSIRVLRRPGPLNRRAYEPLLELPTTDQE